MKNTQLTTVQLEKLLKSSNLDSLSQKNAVVTSAKKLDATEQKNISQLILENAGEGIECVFEVNSELIGGLRVEIGDFIFDGTVVGQLRDLVNTLHN